MINVKMAKPIRPNFFVGTHKTKGWFMERQNWKKKILEHFFENAPILKKNPPKFEND